MGEMADFILEQIDYARFGEHNDESECEDSARHVKSRQCRCCGKTGLEWGLHEGKWRLFDNRGVHSCPKKPLKK